jgi:SSS family solute:Na+ symporter
MGYDVAVGASYAVLYTVLGSFTLLAILTAGYCGSSSLFHKLGCIMIPVMNTEEEVVKEKHSADFFLSARNSAGARAIGLSFFASGMGAWVVYGSTEMGANPNLSWLGVIGYSMASALPAIIICFIGPRVRNISGEHGTYINPSSIVCFLYDTTLTYSCILFTAFCTTDFGLVRYGRLMQFSIGAISVFYSEFK